MRISIALAAGLILASPAFADDAKEGWGFQFRQDTFDKTVFPLAIMSEETKDFDKATMFVACAKDGSLLAAYSPSAIMSFEQTEKVQFRGTDATKDFTFAPMDIPHMGKFRALGKTDSAALIDLFTKAGGEVPFRTDKKQGVFTSIGAAETFKIVQGYCPK
ncbi:MAG: hypothetical protein ACTHKQ_24760 [Mesorhizobium sp.]